MALNAFQRNMLNRQDVAWEIMKILHPQYIDKDTSNKKIGISTKYDWIILSIPNIASIGIEFECHLYSGAKPLHLFKQEVNNNQFRVWRFADDSKFKKYEDLKELQSLYNYLINGIFKKYNVPKPTAQEMSNYYHSD